MFMVTWRRCVFMCHYVLFKYIHLTNNWKQLVAMSFMMMTMTMAYYTVLQSLMWNNFPTDVVSDSIASRGERLELLVDKTNELSENVSTHKTIHLCTVCFVSLTYDIPVTHKLPLLFIATDYYIYSFHVSVT